MARSSFVAGAGVVIGLLTAAPAVAATFTVNSTSDAVDASPGNGVCATASGACTLRAAIQEANALAGSDVIALPAGTYTFTLAGAQDDASATGDLDVSSVIVVNGADASTTIINANGNGRGFEVHAGGNLTLNDVTVQNGFAELQLFSQIGGGILAHPGSALTLMHAIVTHNNARTAGAASASRA